MCKCEKKVENGNEVEVGVLMGIIDILDEIFGSNTTNAAKTCIIIMCLKNIATKKNEINIDK